MSNPFVVGPSTSETATQSLPTLSRYGCCMYSDANGIGILHTLMTTASSLKSLSVQAPMMGSGVLSFSAM